MRSQESPYRNPCVLAVLPVAICLIFLLGPLAAKALPNACSLVFSQSDTRPQHKVKDVVFDLDWTLFYKTSSDLVAIKPENIVRFENDIYRLSDYAIEVLFILQSKGYRISFFSGGSSDRNAVLIQFLNTKMKQLLSQDLIAFKILNSTDLTRTQASPERPFPERFKKDLRKINENIHEIVLVDDIQNFTPADQQSQVVWIGKTFNDEPIFLEGKNRRAAGSEYTPMDKTEWKLEREKLLYALEVIFQKDNSGDILPPPRSLP